jgi:hypothetical protein
MPGFYINDLKRDKLAIFLSVVAAVSLERIFFCCCSLFSLSWLIDWRLCTSARAVIKQRIILISFECLS